MPAIYAPDKAPVMVQTVALTNKTLATPLEATLTDVFVLLFPAT